MMLGCPERTTTVHLPPNNTIYNIRLERLPMFVVEVPQHIWMRFHSISVCKVILEFRLESKLNKNDFLAVEGGGEG